MFNLGKSFLVFLILVIQVNISFALIADYQLVSEDDEAQQNTFSAGQVWSYITRDNEQKSELTILKVDYFENAVVVHIRLDNIEIQDPLAPNGVRTIIPHMAFLQTALQSSVIKIVDKNRRLPDFSKEYQNWREGDGVGTAWAWHFSISEALTGLERLYSNEQQSSSIEDRKKSNN
jgi:hypothetical protein